MLRLEGRGSPSDTSFSRSACTECSRRKQKCNREWPCNHCQKRKVPDKCHFNNPNPRRDRPSPLETSKKRQLVEEEDGDPGDSGSADSDDADFEAIGYSAAHHFAGLTMKPEKKRRPTSKQYLKSVENCPQLERAIQVLPSRPYTDTIVQNFLNKANFHFYIIYPQGFLEAYQRWWGARSANQPLGLQWTCLLLMVCACSTQYTDGDLQKKLESDLGQTTQKLAERYHNAARELHSAVPVDCNHLFNVQQLLHSCCWLTSEGRFVESWHVLNSAVREAQELNLHKESAMGEMSEFDLELRRRIWCVLDTWDWQFSELLSRPKIIDRSDCDVNLPNLTLEGFTPSPLQHMKLQSQLIQQLSKRFGLPKYVTKPAAVQEYQDIIEQWMAEFPSTYHLGSPDQSQDEWRPWIVLHRHYLHTMGYSMLMDPFRVYLAKPMSRSSPPAELKVRSDGINHALKLMDALYSFFDYVYPKDAKFHFVIFKIFDTSAVLCSALMHDQDLSISRRPDIATAIRSATRMLRQLSNAVKAAKTSHHILLRLSQKVLQPSELESRAHKRQKATGTSATPPSQSESPNYASSHSSYVTAPTRSPGTLSSSSVSYSHTTPGGSDSSGAQPLPSGFQYATSPSHHASPPDMQDKYDSMGANATLVGPFAGVDSEQLVRVPHGSTFDPSGADDALPPSAYMGLPPTSTSQYGELGWAGLSDADLAGLADLWNYESLDLTFGNF